MVVRCTWCGDMVSYELNPCRNEECNEELCQTCVNETQHGNFCGRCCGEYEPFRRNMSDYIDV